jgi:hypothetical protein
MKKEIQLLAASLFLLISVNTIYSQLPTFSCSTGNPYSFLTSGPGPDGTNQTLSYSLPFTFYYCGSSYSQISICTNGWAALGSTTSTSSSPNLCTTSSGDRLKLCPYWSALESYGDVHSGTQGSAPNRVFIVQWGCRISGTTSSISAQLRLYESTYIIEFAYGTSPTEYNQNGAIGLIDATGGSGHFISVTPGTPCSGTTTSTTVCNNAVPYIAAYLANGVKYIFAPSIPPPAAPNLITPTNGASNLSLTPTLDWSDVSGATYSVQVSLSGSFGSTVVNQSGLGSSTYSIPAGVLSNGTTYYWRANATTSSGISQWSSVYSFSTLAGPPVAPTLLAPSNGATGQSLTPALDWNDISGATYTIQLSANAGFSSTIVNQSGLNTSNFNITTPLNYGTPYYWRVNATTANGTSAWSTVFSFTTLILTPVRYQRVEFYQNVNPNPANPLNVIEPGQYVRFKVNIQNDLTSNILTGFGTISTSTPNVTVTDNGGTFNNINSGQNGWSVDEFEILIGSNFVRGSNITINLSVTQQTPPVGPWASDFMFPVAPMLVSSFLVDDDNNPDSHGNNNHVCENTETIEVIPLLKNISAMTLYTNQAQLTTPIGSGWIHIWNNQQGATGMVYDTWRLNMVSNVPQPIPPAMDNVLPEQDYVFDYTSPNTYRLPFYDLLTSYYGAEAGPNWSSGGIKIKYYAGFRINPSSPDPIGIEPVSNVIPKEYNLNNNYPNPFNPSTKISFDIPNSAFTSLVIYDLLGRTVETLVDEYLKPGRYEVTWSAANYPSGVYYYKITSGEYTETKKMVLVK